MCGVCPEFAKEAPKKVHSASKGKGRIFLEEQGQKNTASAYGALPGHGLRLPEPLPKPPNGPSPGAHVEPCPRVLMNTGPLLPRGSTKPHISRLPFMPKHTPKHTHTKGYFLYPPPPPHRRVHIKVIPSRNARITPKIHSNVRLPVCWC